MASKSIKSTTSKTDILLKTLRAKNGVSLAQLMTASNWQAHSVRGFLMGTVKKRLGLKLESYRTGAGELRYRLPAGV